MRTLHDLKEAKREKQGQPTRATKQAMYNTPEWKAYVKRFRRENPLCVECLKEGKTSPTWAVDHIVPHGGNERLFWSTKNHQALCREHHNKKSHGERH